jgi:type IX secretion system PorP/SprF family membrane protein
MKNMKRVNLFVIGLCITAASLYGQQQVMFTQYMFNGLAINPAYAGSHETMSVTALAREQWTGLDGAPSTKTFSVHSPLKKERFSLGFLFLQDKIGVTNQNGVYGSYAYRIPVSKKANLAFGIQGGATFYNAQYSKVSATDPAFMNDIRVAQPNVGFGVYFNTNRFYAGISLPQLMQTTFSNNSADSDSKLLRHYFATAGYVFDVSPAVKLKPNLMVKAVNGAPVQFDVNLNALLRDVMWVGFSWRSFDSFDAILQLQLTEQLQVGYSYDFATTTDLSRVNGGSHELMLNYRFTFTKSKIVSPRYF